MITIDIDGQIEARQAQIDDLERQLRSFALEHIDVAAAKFHEFEDQIEQAKEFIGVIGAA